MTDKNCILDKLKRNKDDEPHDLDKTDNNLPNPPMPPDKTGG